MHLMGIIIICANPFGHQHKMKERKNDFMMMIPRKNSFDLWEELFKDPFFDVHESKVMRTDIKENKNNYDIFIDLPGYEKENIKVDVENGYLNITASMDSKHEESKEGKFVKRERYFGECSRSFYVGDNIESEDIKASFKNGTLKLEVPKKEETKELPEKKYIEID